MASSRKIYRAFVLKSLSEEDIATLLRRAMADERGFGGQQIKIADSLLAKLAAFANGDARKALSILEMAVLNAESSADGLAVTEENVEQCTSRKLLLYDKDGEEHYQYAHDMDEKLTNMACLPESLQGRSYYHPTNEGLEGRFAQRLRDIKNWKREHDK